MRPFLERQNVTTLTLHMKKREKNPHLICLLIYYIYTLLHFNEGHLRLRAFPVVVTNITTNLTLYPYACQLGSKPYWVQQELLPGRFVYYWALLSSGRNYSQVGLTAAKQLNPNPSPLALMWQQHSRLLCILCSVCVGFCRLEVPVPWGKPHLPPWVYLDLRQLNHRCRFVLRCFSSLSLEKGIGYSIH